MQQLLRIPEVLRQTGLKRSTLYAALAKNEFPKPLKLNSSGRAVAFLQSEVDSWIEQRVQQRDKGAQHESPK